MHYTFTLDTKYTFNHRLVESLTFSRAMHPNDDWHKARKNTLHVVYFDSGEMPTKIKPILEQHNDLYRRIRKSKHVLMLILEEENKLSAVVADIGPKYLSGFRYGMCDDPGEYFDNHACGIKYIDSCAGIVIPMLEKFNKLSDKDKSSRNHPTAENMSNMQDAMHEAANAFIANLDNDVVSFLLEQNEFNEKLLAWIMLSKEKRFQAIKDYNNFAFMFNRYGNELARIIDLGGGSLTDYFCEKLLLSKTALKYFRDMPKSKFSELMCEDNFQRRIEKIKQSFYSGTVYNYGSSTNWIGVLNYLGPSQYPTNNDDWSMLTKFAHDVSQVLEQKDRSRIYSVFQYIAQEEHFAEVVKKEYTNYRKMKNNNNAIYQQSFNDTKDAVRELLWNVMIPAMASTGMLKKNCNFRQLMSADYKRLHDNVTKSFSDISLHTLLRFSHEWHKRDMASRRYEGGSDTDNKTENESCPLAFIDDVNWSNGSGYSFELIANDRELMDEGKIMKHCIYSYKDSFMNGTMIAFRVFGPKGFRATATIGCRSNRDNRTTFLCHDMECAGNSPPSTKGIAALNEFVDFLNDRSYTATVPEEAKRALYNNGKNRGMLFDHPDFAREIAETNFSMYQPFLPKKLRAKSAIEFLEGPMFDAVEQFMLKKWKTEVANKINDASRKFAA